MRMHSSDHARARSIADARSEADTHTERERSGALRCAAAHAHASRSAWLTVPSALPHPLPCVPVPCLWRACGCASYRLAPLSLRFPSLHSAFCLLSAGLPVPVESVVTAAPRPISFLPRGGYVVSVGVDLYAYDPVMQETKRIFNLIDYFSQPNAGGLSLGGTATCPTAGAAPVLVGGFNITTANTGTWWRDTLYDAHRHERNREREERGERRGEEKHRG